jgi:hypothetical protein
MSKRRGVPAGFRRLLAALTEADKLRKFRIAHKREPASEEELNAFIERLARGLYNDGWDEWPENDEECD